MADTSQIKEHMDVISSDKKTLGEVDHLEGSNKDQADQTEFARRRSPSFYPRRLD